MPATTDQPLGATASSRSVSRLRRQGKHPTDTNNDPSSRASSIGDDSTDTADTMKSSMDSAIDKVRERARKSVDERRGSDDSASATRLSALIARKLKRKDKDKDTSGGLPPLPQGSDERPNAPLLPSNGPEAPITPAEEKAKKNRFSLGRKKSTIY